MEISIQHRNALARNWLKSRTLFNIAALCRSIDYDRGSFARFEEGHHDLKEDALERLEKALAPYGYITLI